VQSGEIPRQPPGLLEEATGKVPIGESSMSDNQMVSEILPCPYCGQQAFLIERLDSDASVVICQGLTGPHEACLARGPVGVAQDEGEEQPGRDKAIELWNARAEQNHGEPVASSVFNDPLYNAESDARNASALLEEALEWFDDGCGRSPEEFKLLRKIGDWLGRSVSRIDRGGDECAHSYANKDGCPECGEAFAGAEPSAPECKYCGDTGKIMVGRSGDANDGNAPILESCEDCDRGAPVERDELAAYDALRSFVGAAYPVSSSVNERGHNWSEAYLDEALLLARAALERKPS
jgi:DNA-directed RNA polymerase subunit RPC12/RpoP